MNPLVYCYGERVFVYRNLHRKCYSVKSLKTNRVLCHVDEIILFNVKFRVGKAGRERVLREKRKNVHAGVVGYVADVSMLDVSMLRQRIGVTYNPYKYDSFVRDDKSPIYEAKIAHIDNFGILAVE